MQITNTEVYGFEASLRGMRNPMNSWEKSDSFICKDIYPMTQKEIDESCGICPKGAGCDICDTEPHYIVGNNGH